MPMSTITNDDVRYVASLAKIAVSDDEVASLTKELAVILDYVKQLDVVDTAGLEPTYQVTGLTNVTRADELINYAVTRDGLLANTPRTRDGYIEVPKVL